MGPRNSYRTQHRATRMNKAIFWAKGLGHHCTMDSGESSRILIRESFRNSVLVAA